MTLMRGLPPPTLPVPSRRARTIHRDEGTIPCRDHDAELWFAEQPAEVELAKALCGPCPLRMQCLAGALERQEPWGVWGGQLLVEGAVVPRKRPRGRPRKQPLAA